MPGGQSGSTLGASLVVLDKSTGTSISGSTFFTCFGLVVVTAGSGGEKATGDTALVISLPGTAGLKSGFNRLSMEKGKNLGVEFVSIASDTFSTSVGVGGGDDRRLDGDGKDGV